MARKSWLWVSVLAWTLVACSGGREEDLSCDDLSPCRDGSSCINGFCQDTSQATVGAFADSAGAEIPVLVIDAAGNICEAQSCQGLPYGTQVTFRAGSAPGYRFTGWTGTEGCTGTNVDLVIPNLQVETHCTANYVRRVKVAAHTSGAEGGVTASSDSPFAICNGGVCEVDAGQPVKLRADDRFGQRFTGWSGPGCGSATTFETTVVASNDLLCVANFVERIVVSAAAMNAQTTIEVSSDGAVCEPGSCILDKGGNATLVAPAVPKFRFAGWSGTTGCVGADPTLRFSALQESETCLATYTPRVTVRGSSAGATPPPAITALSSDLYAACDGGACDTDLGGGVTLLASSAAGYRLAGWSGEACMAMQGAAVKLTEVKTDTQCVANYILGIAVIGAVVGAPGEVTATSSTAAAMCAAGGCVIDIGGNATLAAPAPAGYRFLGWDGDDGCATTATTVSFSGVQQSKTCYARFAARYLVRGTESPAEGGTVTASSISPGAVCQDDGCTLDGGGEVALTVTTKDGYRFSGWSGGGACTGTDTTVRIANVQGNTTCQANFVGRFTVAGLAVPANGGSVVATSDSGAATCTGASCQVDRGSRVSMTATAAEGFRFVSWSGCPGAAGATLTLENITQDMSCTASFTPLRYTVSSGVAPAGSGSVLAAANGGNAQCNVGQCSVDWGTSVSLTATPALGWRFGGWSGCGAGNDATITLPNVRADANCQATFQRITFTVTGAFAPANAGNVTINATGPSATCTGLRCTVPYGGGATLVASPATGWNFGGWSGCSTSMDTTLQLNNVTGNADCVANFTRQRFNVVGNANPADGGSVTASSNAQGALCNGGGCAVNYGSNVTLRATPATGWRFANWTGCANNSANAEITLQDVTANATCVATFARLRFTVTGVAGAGGAVLASSPDGDCNGGACTVNYGSAVALMAVPGTGFQFTGWMCPVTGGPAISIPNVTANVTCTATFQRLAFTVNAAGAPVAGGRVVVAASNDATCNGATCTVLYGGSVTYDATPSTGYDLTGWSGSCTALPNDATRAIVPNVTAPASCVANFTLRTYRVAGAAGTGGSISNATTTAGTCGGAVCTVSYGGSATFTAAVDTGFSFGGWTGCTANPQNPLQATVANVTAAATCTASFTRLRFPVTGASNGGGVVLAASNGGDCAANACTVNYGSDVALMAMPATGFRFTGWTECQPQASAGITIANVTGPVTCTANFTPLTFQVSGGAAPAAGGAVSVIDATAAACTGTTCTVQYGGSVTYQSVDSAGYDFLNWSGCTALADNPRRAQVANVTGTATCVANYRLRTYTVRGLAATAGSTTSIGGSVTAASTTAPGSCTSDDVCTVVHGGNVSFTATVNEGYLFSGWTGSCTASGLSAGITGVTASASCTANFVRQTFTVGAGAGSPFGSASVASGTCSGAACTVASGDTATLTATPGRTGRFTGWSCLNSTTGVTTSYGNASQRITVTGNTNCTAGFVQRVTVVVRVGDSRLGTISVTPVIPGAGALSCVPSQVADPQNPQIVQAGSTCTVDANTPLTITTILVAPNNNYFYQWSPPSTPTPTTCPTANGSNASTQLNVGTSNLNCLGLINYLLG